MSIDRARLSVKFAIERLRAQTGGLFDQQYPGDHPGPREWLSLVAGLLDTADAFLSRSDGPLASPMEAHALVSDAANLLGSAYASLSVMRGATIDDLPYPSVLPLQRWFNQLEIRNTTIFRAELVANYELKQFDRDDFADISSPSESLASAIDSISWPVLRVTVPSRAFTILPHFAIVAHEIGHALYSKMSLDLSVIEPEKARLIERIRPKLGSQTADSNIENALSGCFARWYQEIAADAIAFCLTGPAIYFSLSEFLQLMGGGYGLSPTHPANDLRRKILFEELRKDGQNSFAHIFQEHTGQELTEDFNSPLLARTPPKEVVFQDINREYSTEMAAILPELHEWIPIVVDSIYEKVTAYLKVHAPDALYTPSKYQEDLQIHLQAMLAAIPPNESGADLSTKRPTEFASILNVGWAALLTKLPDLRVKSDDGSLAGKLERLHSLLLKAVELSEIRRSWRSV